MTSIDHIPMDIKILVVDDYSTMRGIIKALFRELGFKNFVDAEDGREALMLLKKQPVDLIVSDWNMPNMMGIDLLRAVRQDKQLQKIPFLMVTAESKRENVIVAVQAGVSDYVVKPFTPDVLRGKLLNLFQ
jgi:two-component system, chemotaxis family, chemotaxis protein CheY